MNKKLFFSVIVFSALSHSLQAKHWRPFGLPFFESRVDIARQSSGKMFPEWGDLIDQMENTFQSQDIKIYKTKDGKRWGIEMALPGFNNDEINISIKENGILTIRAETKQENKDEENKENKDRIYIYKSERKKRSFYSRTFKLPKNIDWQNSKETKLSYEDDILKIEFAKKKIAKPEEITLRLDTQNSKKQPKSKKKTKRKELTPKIDLIGLEELENKTIDK